MADSIETYLDGLRDIRSSGAVKETSGYGVLANLLDAMGHTLKPKVRCFIHPKNSGAGLPDGGLFTPDQLKNTDEEAPLHGIPLPARGVIEVKATDAEVDDIAETPQVRDYVKHYGQVLVTNYRDFLLLKRGENGNPVRLEFFQLAPDEAAFWQIAAHPRKAAHELGERFSEYLKRVLLHAAPLNNPRDVAFFLASYARDARARVEAAGNLPALAAVRTALEEALGMKFEAERGEHFFRSTLVQTLFYGVFSAWVLWHKEQTGRASVPASPHSAGKVTAREDARPPVQFDWKSAAWTLHVPMIKALFEQVATPTKLGPLALVEVLDWTAAALNRVVREEFFARFVEDHAVQYFYEPFLEAFDPELRKQLGVWYTPPEIVRYQVARVDAALREELDIADGLADPRVFVLDPCCGTGAYLVEVLRKIGETLAERGEGDALNAADVKKAAQERIFGFELLPAPFVVAHLQMGLLLQSLGIPLDDVKERAAIYLTNALTGWEPPSEEAKKQLTFAIPEFQQEKEAADEIKQEKRIIVILGNPPYNGFAGLAIEEERDLTTAYRKTKRAPAPQGQGLNDLYIRFFRMAERRIVEKSGEGIISFISNYSWLDGLSFTGMRERYLEVFDSITVDCLNGDKYKTGKLTPEGKPDPSVFSTESNREGIQVGTAIATLVKRRDVAAQNALGSARASRAGEGAPPSQTLPDVAPAIGAPEKVRFGETPKPARETRALPGIHFRHIWGKEKRAELLASLGEPPEKIYTRLEPPLETGLPFLPSKTQLKFFKWPLLTELLPVSFPGVKTSRDEALVAMNRATLEARMEKYFDPKVSNEEIKLLLPVLMEKTQRFDAAKTREYLLKRGIERGQFVRLAYRPFDIRWLYWEPETKLLDEKRSEYFAQIFPGNLWLFTTGKTRKSLIEAPVVTELLTDLNYMDSGARGFPIFVPKNVIAETALVQETPDMFADGGGGGSNIKPNLTPSAAAYLSKLHAEPDALFFHIVAILHAPDYRAENAGALRQDWPRIPLPKSRDALLASAELGKRVAALLDTETPVKGVTAGTVRPEFVKIAVLTRLTKDALNLSLTAGWGHAGQNGVTMPGKGKVETHPFTAEEAEAVAVAALYERRAGLRAGPARCLPLLDGHRPPLQGETHDIYLNDSACWRNVPQAVWDYTIGGYQVIKKWLSYRELELLGRALTPDEAREVTHMARRIAALILLQPELDRNYQAVSSASVTWSDFATGAK